MPIAAHPEWLPLALYALGAAVLLTLLFRIPKVGAVLRGLFSLAMLALALFVLFQQAPFDPNLSRFTERLGLNRQAVMGEEVRIRMSPDGHFWANASVNGAPLRMLVDTGATVTVLSQEAAGAAGVDGDVTVVPMLVRTANGVIRARTGTLERLTIGGIEARGLKVVIAPGLGPVNVLGMNFLSGLKSWRVEGRTLILSPQGAGAGVKASPAAP